MWHGILIDEAFRDKKLLKKFNIVSKKQRGVWFLLKIEFSDDDLEKTIQMIQSNMIDTFYSHLYNREGSLIVIFKRNVFRITSDKSRWKPPLNMEIRLAFLPDNWIFILANLKMKHTRRLAMFYVYILKC